MYLLQQFNYLLNKIWTFVITLFVKVVSEIQATLLLKWNAHKFTICCTTDDEACVGFTIHINIYYTVMNANML